MEYFNVRIEILSKSVREKYRVIILRIGIGKNFLKYFNSWENDFSN